MSDPFNILVVEDDKLTGEAICNHLTNEGFRVVLFKSAEEAFLYFQQHPVELAVFDYRLPGMSGEDLFKKIRSLDPLLPVIFMTSLSSIDQAVHLLQMGAFSYLAKPIKPAELSLQIKSALEKVALRREIQHLKEELNKKIPL